jgi:hypothetical protein
MGQLNLPSTMPVHASQMYAKNIQNLLDLLIKDGRLAPDYEDEIVRGTVITRQGEIAHEMTRQRLAEAGVTVAQASSPGVAGSAAEARVPEASVVSIAYEPAAAGDAPTAPTLASSPSESTLQPIDVDTSNELLSVPFGAIAGDGTVDCPEGFPIKGNASSGIYHEPDSASYAQTIPEFCFASSAEAEAAGFRASKT